MHTNTRTGSINEYVCPAEGKRTKMNSSVVLHAVSSSQSRMKQCSEGREKETAEKKVWGGFAVIHTILHLSFLF